jgi:putative sigma-54 modulation protein
MEITIRRQGTRPSGPGQAGHRPTGGSASRAGGGPGGRGDDDERTSGTSGTSGAVSKIPADLRRHVDDKLRHVTRHLDGMDRAEVRFTTERSPRITDNQVCEVTMHGHGHVLRVRAAGPDLTTAVDRAASKLEHAIDKLKGKLVDRSHPRRSRTLDVHSAQQEEADEADEADGQPRIVKTKKFGMKPMTPEEAAMQMDLVGHAFYLFTNAETGQAGVVYRRNDGQIGLIDAD